MTITALVGIARQVSGEYVQVRVVKAGVDRTRLESLLARPDLPRTMTADGVDYVIEYALIDNIVVDGAPD